MKFKAVFSAVFLAALVTGGAFAQSAKLEPRPLLQQCEALLDAPTLSEKLKAELAQLKSGDAKARQAAVQQLGQSCQAQLVEPLIELLRAEDMNVRIAAIETLGLLGAKDAVDWMAELTGDPAWQVRLALVQSLSSFKTFKAKNTVLNGIVNPNDVVVSEDDDMRVRCIGILTLNQLRDVQFSRKGVQFMYGFLRSNRLNIRTLAEETMRALKETRNGPAELVGILKQHNMPEMRRWAAFWLGELHIERGREALTEAAANDSAPAVKHVAAEALAKLNAAQH